MMAHRSLARFIIKTQEKDRQLESNRLPIFPMFVTYEGPELKHWMIGEVLPGRIGCLAV
ncbi:hypothetical protein Pla22_40460 [Rubripirellula amarantea]|uniref:Uncharacterized protein n=1 Tax=Rubripirellula amarantea TaxID=2527999 RepID=A0A5C5WMF2_9BACT|nr:hypothetical protein Pla22_40460 [Rubripirellula amarantea]